jgi:hypothetical protein
MVSFVNPYTFVPHAPAPVRREPYGHERMGPGRFSGVLNVRLTARTPLVIGGFSAEGDDLLRVPRQLTGGRLPIIPGSGLLGSVRSVHEALAGGCLRVLNAGFAPVHRHPASTDETARLRFAVVSRVDRSGRPLQVQVCEEWMRVPVSAIATPDGRLPAAGDQLRHPAADGRVTPVPAKAIVPKNGRRTLQVNDEQLPDGRDKYPGGVRPGSLVPFAGVRQVTEDCWVLLVTDTKARGAELPPYFAAGRFARDSRRHAVPPSAWEMYLETVDGADDLRPAQLATPANPTGKEPPFNPADPQTVAVTSPQDRAIEIARRLPARKYLYAGQPVWVELDDITGEVTEIRLSMLWRYQGTGTVAERSGAAGPCQEPDKLCWSCRLFGSADLTARGENDVSRQSAYRGHVRFEDLVAEGDFASPTWHLAPLSSPRPSAGQFYLDSTKSPKKLADKYTRPATTWGSVADRPRRNIRGRKLYWRTEHPTEEEHPRGRFREEHQAANLGKRAELIPAGTVFTGRVWFDNLDAADYGSLLAALDPRLLAAADAPGWSGTVTSVGGAKPFGFGAVSIEVEAGPGAVQTARMRYLGQDGAVTPPADAVGAFAAALPDTVRGNWERLRHALTFGYVSDDVVWYPAVGGEKGSKEFDESFEFFAETTGVQLDNRDKPLVQLPDPGGSPEDQVIRWPPRNARAGNRGARNG